MLPIVLVLLVATSALAAPAVDVGFVNLNQVGFRQDNAGAIDRALLLVDEADLSLYAVQAKNGIYALGNLGDQSSNAHSLAQALGVLISIADGVPGDSCAAAALINAVANNQNVGPALQSYLSTIIAGIDSIVRLSQNPEAARYSRGVAGNCQGGGRSYNLEGAWNVILANANRNNAGILNEQLCAARRLYNASSVRSNNVAAALTAASLPQVNNMVMRAAPAVANFIGSVGTLNVVNAGIQAKLALTASM